MRKSVFVGTLTNRLGENRGLDLSSLSQQACSARALTSPTRVAGGFLHSPARPGPARPRAPPLPSGPLPSYLPQHRPLICRTIPFGRAAARTDHRQAAAVFPRGDAKLSTERPTRATRSVFPLFLCLSSSITLSSLSQSSNLSLTRIHAPFPPFMLLCPGAL
ncbi:hypothetical protein G5714_014357 [Onychostoma macrolepis]|uniref:Uncharacterized protein n=1 Tax=Onychostoma macrolepis TaxID=369639 RepID=A0A7J6CD41_9TELE|nr:hypothetical protein G5714_014357 [Onychostoma macrolepis]